MTYEFLVEVIENDNKVGTVVKTITALCNFIRNDLQGKKVDIIDIKNEKRLFNGVVDADTEYDVRTQFICEQGKLPIW